MEFTEINDEAFSIDDVVVQPREGKLIVNGTEEKLDPRVMDVLLALARHAPNTLSRDALTRLVWGNTAVTDDALTFCIGRLRKLLGDDKRQPRFIETVHKKGYRLLVVPQRGQRKTESTTTSTVNQSQSSSVNIQTPTARQHNGSNTRLIAITLIALISLMTIWFSLTHEQPTTQTNKLPTALRPAKILWVDDIPANNEYEQTLFKTAGVSVVLARSTTEALQRLQSESFDMIVSDLLRQEGPREGMVLLAQLRANHIETPFVFFTESNAPAFIADATEHGALKVCSTSTDLITTVVNTINKSTH